MSKTVKTKIEIIDETVEYYSNNKRGLNKLGNCVYLNKEDNSMCAVGRCLLHPELMQNNKSIGFLNADKENFDNLFKYEYRGHEVDFWSYLQSLHDGRMNWNGQNLTPIGKNCVNKLKIKYENN